MSEHAPEPTSAEVIEVEVVKPAKKAAKAKPVVEASQTEKARANAIAKMKAAGR